LNALPDLNYNRIILIIYIFAVTLKLSYGRDYLE
jgi:hypothetical protein